MVHNVNKPCMYEPHLYPPGYIKLSFEKEIKKMANFDKAFDITMGHEGGYTNDPDDAGGETYRGIARNYHPHWSGWNIIDDTKPNIDASQMDPYVREFYEDKFWDINRLDDFDDQAIANEMFDTGVNMGVGRAARFLQECLNYLNRNGSLFKDLVVDGKIGSASLAAMNEIESHGDTEILLIMMNVCQGRHYMEYMSKSPTQEKYARGWFKRVKLSKD